MPTPTDFLQDADGDLDFSSGLKRTPDLNTFVAQALSVNFNWWLGEWFLNLNAGLPFQRVIGQRPDLNLFRSIFTKAALATRGVASVKSIGLAFDGRTRTLTVQPFGLVLVDGTTVPDPGEFEVKL